MIIPRTVPTQPWWQQAAWRTFALTLFRYYSRLSTYAVQITRRCPIAAVDPQARVMYLNPDLIAPAGPGAARHDPVDDVARRALALRALAAHEAGHVQFSGAKPSALLGQLWNALEDERMERLMIQTYPELDAAFAYFGDAVADSVRDTWKGTTLEGCLAMRFEHDRAQPAWTSANPEEWADVWPLVQAAWRARDSDQVTWIAQCILDLLGLNGDEPWEPFPLTLSADGADHPTPDEPPGPSGPTQAAPPPDPTETTPLTCAAPTEGAARLLAAALRAAPRPTRRVPHDTRGALSVGRYLDGQERVFRTRVTPQVARDLHVTWVVDRSGSMGVDGRMDAAVTATLMGLRAAELAQVPVRVIAFDDAVEDTVMPTMPPAQAQAAVRLLSARGTTDLSPALHRALTGPRDPRARHLLVIICDGELDENDLQSATTLARAHPDVLILPVLIGEATEYAPAWRSAFGPLLIARDHTHLAQLIHSRLRRVH